MTPYTPVAANRLSASIRKYTELKSSDVHKKHLTVACLLLSIMKVEGTWKIWVDSDTSYSGTVTEKDFLSGEILKLTI